MIDRTSIEKDIGDARRSIAGLEKEVKQLRDWIVQNERSLNGMQEALRRITEDGLVKARADLAQRENTLQRLRADLATQEKIVGKLNEMDRKQREIAQLEQDQERLIVLLEKQRSDLRQLQDEYEQLTQPPAPHMPCEVVLPNNQRLALDANKGDYVIGWHDGSAGQPPDIDLHPLHGGSLGVSRRHAILRSIDGEWTITDLSSTNGTFLNEAPLQPNSVVALRDKTRIRLGNLTIFFRYITQTTRL
ncbi:MAG: FHA domain-containing protein [Oscillochloris sp.]|nr:FHA domain-containing protein [Oscillochloris sp.]